MTCQFCPNPTRGENCRTCWDCIGKVARDGSGKAHGWTDFESNAHPAKIEQNKRISEARVKLARLQGRAV